MMLLLWPTKHVATLQGPSRCYRYTTLRSIINYAYRWLNLTRDVSHPHEHVSPSLLREEPPSSFCWLLLPLSEAHCSSGNSTRFHSSSFSVCRPLWYRQDPLINDPTFSCRNALGSIQKHLHGVAVQVTA